MSTPDRSTQSIVIDAPPERIMAVIADFDAYPEWTDAFKSAEVLETGADGRARQVRMTIEQGPVKDTYTLEYEWAPDGRSVRWHLVKGAMQKAQDGSYTLVPSGGGTEVTYSLSVQLAIPMIGQLRRKAEKVIMDTALKELKRRVEEES
ncbi:MULTISPECIES: SRPBCC family protein [Sciscionella]|uniref:SRPBCC family protein n=1 Tax=Sciscionella TaxID=596495 RepID=UPI000374805C|nr:MULTISPECIES: SRPBCC family protein [Sciscionella]